MDTKHDGKTKSRGAKPAAKGGSPAETKPSEKPEVSFDFSFDKGETAVGAKENPAAKPEERELEFFPAEGPALLRGGRNSDKKAEEEKEKDAKPSKKGSGRRKKKAPEKPEADNQKKRSGKAEKKRGKADKKHGEKKHGSEKDELDTSSVAVARGISHEARRRKQNLHDLLKIGAIALVIGLLVGAGILGYRLTTVKKITVTGSEKYSEEQLLSMSRIHAGDSYFSYSEKELTDAMNAISDIRTVSVTKKLPNKISIVVADILPRAAIESSSGHYSIISADGYVLSVGETDANGLTVIRGMSGEGISLNTFINKQSPTIRTMAAIKLLAAIDESPIRDSVLEIDLSSSVYVTLELEGNYSIVLGSVTTAHECIETAAKAYAKFLPVYPNGGEIQVFFGKTTVDFTPAG